MRKTSNAIPTVLEFLKRNYGTSYLKAQIVEATKLSVPAVTAAVNFLRDHGYVDEKVETYVEQPATETRKEKVKTIRHETLNEKGLEFDYDAYAAERAAKEAAHLAALKAAKASK